MIPILYDKGETDFTNNGLCELRDAASVIVTEERNGLYECDFEFPVNGANFDLIQIGRIIVVKHDSTNDVQPFDIVSCTKPINGAVSFHAVHISYRQSKIVASGENITGLDAALDMLKGGEPSNPFVYWTDKASGATFPLGDGIPRSVREMLGGTDGSILDTYGGEFEFDWFDVKLWENRGEDVDFSIRYGLNMTDYEDQTDISESYSAIVAYWSGSGENNEQIVIKTPMVSDGTPSVTGRVECVAMDLSSDFESQPTEADLANAALNVLATKQPSLPSQTIKVDFINLDQTGEYDYLRPLLRCKLCDRIRVVFPFYKLDSYFKIVKVTYDALRERYTSMELGTLSTTLSEALGIGSVSSSGGSSGGGGGGGAVYRLTKSGDIITLTGGDTSSSVTDSDTKYGLSINGHTVALVAGGSDSSVTVPDNFTTEYETKLNDIEAGAEVNVQSDWNVTDTTSDAYIKNKPTIPSAVQPTTTTPKMDGTADVGSESKYARGDHVHPSDTTKVDKVTGKGLSTNDFTDTLLTKLNGIASGAEVNVNADWNASSGDAQILNKPSIPTKTSELTNDSNFIGGNVGGLFYGTCSTAGNASAKVVTCSAFKSTDLIAGTFIVVSFTNQNSAATGGLTLNVQGTGAKHIKYINNGTLGNLSSAGYLKANTEYPFYYDGANWVCWFNVNTTYSALSEADMHTGTATTARLITAQRLKQAVEYHAPVTSVNGQTGAVTIDVPDAISDLTNDMIYDLGTVSRGQFTITEAQRTAVATMWAKGLCAVTLTNDSEKFYAIKERTVTYSGLDFYGFVGSYAGLSATGTPQTGICIVGICTTQNIGIFGAVDDLDQDDVETIISSYLPTAVTVAQKTTSGTNIADITIGGTTTKLYAPTGGGGGITVLDCYPVGSYYETSDTSFDPNTAWGGTWVLDSKGRVTISRDETIADFNTVGKTGGEKTHTLTVNEMPSHTHRGMYSSGTGQSAGMAGVSTNHWYADGYNEATGGGQAHNNMPPYIVVNRWHRTA